MTEYAGVGEATWVGLDNYREIFSDQRYVQVLKNTMVYGVVVVVFQNGLGLIFAAILNSIPAVRDALRTALLVPSMLSLVIAGYVWQYLYAPMGGGLNELLASFGMGSMQQIWLGDSSIALFSVAAVHVWMFVGYSTAIFLAGYAGISTEVKDAARVDGVSPIKSFFHIDIPLLAPAITVNITLATIGTLKSFEFPFIMTGGGPDYATMTLGLKIFQLIFQDFKYGSAAALSVVMIVLVAMITIIQNSYLRAREDRI
ncbi:sugar ABC transporter permease [Vibrio vulnificus]|nr:sugar ABC transporter permease [Vibrio vulnificus]RZP71877.1 sugar ABC transporter permease [Vibrio vulnificus]RZP85132.1 sugar ABC transporter permease [Vibrio vulnificus]RZP86313.1 sugar ABC transporter permease [Vibrio vulnificus]RZQ74609.1 sugar ABC transporter permease [Vibrio vulnificus]